MKMAKTSRKGKAEIHGTDQSEALVRLKRIKGQLEGVERMIADERYCVDIVNQIRSIVAALRSAENLVMDRHVRHCVSDAVQAKDPRRVEEKIDELLDLFRKR